MAETMTIAAEYRQETGKGIARQLRRAGKVPAVVYGHGREPESLEIPQAELDRVLAVAGSSTVVELKLGGKKLQTLIREVQRHATKSTVLHVDFMEIRAGEAVTVRAPIRLEGSPDGVRNQGGILDQSVGQSMHVSDLVVPNAEILDDPDATICSVVAPRVEAEPVVVAEEEEEEALEPELIRKPKGEGEAEGEEEAGSPEPEK